MRKLWALLVRAFKWGEHADFGNKLLDLAVDWRVLMPSVLGSIGGVIAYIEHRPWSEVIIISLSILVLLLALIWGGVMFVQFLRRSPHHGTVDVVASKTQTLTATDSDITEYVALSEAAAKLYGDTRGSEIAEFAERSDSGSDPAGSANAILDWYAYWMSLKHVIIYGRHPPSLNIEEIPKRQIESHLRFEGGAMRLMEDWNKEPIFIDLCVRQSDLLGRMESLLDASK